MSLFLFSAVLAFFLHQIGSVLQPKVSAHGRVRLRTVRIQLPAAAYVRWKAGFYGVAAVVFLLAITLILANKLHPSDGYAVRFSDALTSPRMAGALFGGLVGALTSNLVGRVVQGGPEYELATHDKVKLVLIIALAVLGIGGEEAIQSFGRRITGIKIGATSEISLAEEDP
jgi:hypothetical protein